MIDPVDAGKMVTLPALLATIRGRITPVQGLERVALTAALGRVLGETVIAPRSLPAWDNAAMDGYAVAAADTGQAEPRRLVLAGRAAAGAPWPGRLLIAGQTVRILTGAPAPAGCAAVVIEEDCLTEANAVVVPAAIKPGSNLRRAGEDVVAGEPVLAAGHRLRPFEIGLLAALGRETITVHRRLRVAICSSGNELREPGTVAGEGAIFDANRYLLHASLQELGCQVTDLGILGDDREHISAALAGAAADHDLLVTSGGMSLSEEDHLKAAFLAAGGEFSAWRAAIKPGKPVGVGHLGPALFLGLPGNPAAVAVLFQLLVRPALGWLSGASDGGAWPRVTVRAAFNLKRVAGRREYLNGQLMTDDDGATAVRLGSRQGSHVLSGLVRAEVLIEIGETVAAVRPGDPVAVLALCPP